MSKQCSASLTNVYFPIKSPIKSIDFLVSVKLLR